MIYKKLAEIQKELFVPKGQHNDFGKYSYRSCEDILQAVKPLCEQLDCVLTLTNELININERIYVQATATLTEIETGEKVSSTAHAREEAEKKGMDSSQITGAASSYARKYALAGLFCIDNEKDSDATNNGIKEPQNKSINQTTNTPSAQTPAQTTQKTTNNSTPIEKDENGMPLKAIPAQIDFLKSKYTGDNLNKLLNANNINKIEDLPFETAASIINKIKGVH